MRPLVTSANDGKAFKEFLEKCNFVVTPERFLQEQKDPAVIKAAFGSVSKMLAENFKSMYLLNFREEIGAVLHILGLQHVDFVWQLQKQQFMSTTLDMDY